MRTLLLTVAVAIGLSLHSGPASLQNRGGGSGLHGGGFTWMSVQVWQGRTGQAVTSLSAVRTPIGSVECVRVAWLQQAGVALPATRPVTVTCWLTSVVTVGMFTVSVRVPRL